jgi:hypothetical protein
MSRQLAEGPAGSHLDVSIVSRRDSIQTPPPPITGPKRHPMISFPLCCSEAWLVGSEDMRGHLFIYLSIYLFVYLFIYVKGCKAQMKVVQHSRESRW